MEHDESEKIRLLGILDFQIQEIEEAKLTKGEDEKLEADIRTASHAEHITEGLQTAMAAMDGSERHQGMMDGIAEIRRSLLKNASYDPRFEAMAAKAEALSYELEELRDEISSYADSMSFDGPALDRMQSRLATIEKLKRKYGFSVEDILAFAEKPRRIGRN